MANSVVYKYILKDQYSAHLKKIRLETAAFNKQITGLQTNLNTTAQSLRKVTKSASKTKNKFKGLGASISGAGRKMRSFGTSSTVMFTSLASALALKKVTGDAMDLESAMTDVTKVFGDKGALAPFQNQLSKVGSALGQSREEMNKLAFQSGKLGIPLDEVSKFAELTGKVAIAFDTDLGQATVFLADMRTKMGLSNAELKTTLDTVNTLADSTSAGGADILQVTQRLAGTFKSLHVPPDVAVAFSTIARQLEVGPARGARAMKMFVQGLQAGKNVDVFGGNMGVMLQKNFKGTIASVLSGLRKIPEGAKGMMVQDIFGRDAAPFVLNLMSSQKLLNRTLGIAADKATTVGSMQREVNRKMKTAEFQTRQMKTAFKNLSAEMGTTLLPAFKEIVGSLKDIALNATAWVKENPKIAKFGAIALIIGASLTAVSVVLGSIAVALGGIAIAATFIGAPFILTSLAILAIIAGLGAMWSLMVKIKNLGFLATFGMGGPSAKQQAQEQANFRPWAPGAEGTPAAPSSTDTVATKGSKSTLTLDGTFKALGLTTEDMKASMSGDIFDQFNTGINTAGAH